MQNQELDEEATIEAYSDPDVLDRERFLAKKGEILSVKHQALEEQDYYQEDDDGLEDYGEGDYSHLEDYNEDDSPYIMYWYQRKAGETMEEYYNRQHRYVLWLDAIDLVHGEPRAAAVVEVLKSNVDLEVKKKTVAEWITWYREFFAPNPIKPPPSWIGRPGGDPESRDSVRRLKRSEHWERYQRDLTKAREARRQRASRADEKKFKRAETWLDELEERVNEARGKGDGAVSRLIVQVEKRLGLVPAEAAERYRRLLK